MSLSDLSSLGSFVSGIAVLVSLIYLSFQIRQNTLHQRATMQQGRAAREVDIILRTAEPALADVMMRGRMGDASLAPAELEQFLRVATAMFLNFEDGFLQAKAGMLEQRNIEGDDEALRKHIFPHLGYSTAWTMLAPGMQTEFRTHIDGLLRETPVAHVRDRIATWKALLAESETA